MDTKKMHTFDAEARAKAVETRKAKLAAAGLQYKQEWADSGVWDELAKRKGIRLPLWSKAPTPRFLKRWHETLDTEDFEAVYGCSPSRLIAMNPSIPLRAFVGMMLERAQT